MLDSKSMDGCSCPDRDGIRDMPAVHHILILCRRLLPLGRSQRFMSENVFLPGLFPIPHLDHPLPIPLFFLLPTPLPLSQVQSSDSSPLTPGSWHVSVLDERHGAVQMTWQDGSLLTVVPSGAVPDLPPSLQSEINWLSSSAGSEDSAKGGSWAKVRVEAGADAR